MQDTFYIVGQTAAGKTAAALLAAERCNAEIVSADAFQVYAGLDLLTAKPAPKDLERVAHHLVGSVALEEAYNVARFREDALAALAAIHARGRRAIVAGGSGMYVKALTHGLSPLPSSDPKLRADLNALDAPVLFTRLRELDSATANVIDAKNKRRLVRALEVCLTAGSPFSMHRERWLADSGAVKPRGVFLFRDREDLHARIDERVEAIFAAGVVEEVRLAIANDAIGPTAERIIGLADIRLYLARQLTLEVCKDRIKAATRQYAKRQMTWFKREKVFEPVNLTQVDGSATISALMTPWSESSGL